MAEGERKGKLLKVSIIGTLRRVIPLGFEPKTHSLEGYPKKRMLITER